MTRAPTAHAPTAHAPAGARRPAARPGPAHGGDAHLRERRREAEAADDLAGRLGLDRGAGPGSLPLRLALAALANPVLTGGVLVTLVAVTAIVSNAVGGQPRKHPAPLFQTRTAAGPATPAAAPPREAPGRAAEAERTPPPRSEPPVREVAAAQPVDPNPTATLPRAKPKGADQAQLVRDVQAILRDRGTYLGPVDGIPGPATAEAIRGLERALGLPQTGEASDRLVSAYAHAQATARVAAAPQAIPVKTSAVAPPATGPTPPAPLGRSSGPEPLAQGGSEKLQRVQRNLTAAGYGPLRQDGKLDERTQEAIRRYELDRGWQVTGKLSDRLVLDSMVAAGAPH